MQTRRQFGKVIAGGALGVSVGMTTMGLSCGSVFQDIETYVPIGLAAFQEVVTLINPIEAALLTPIINLVKASFADLTAAINQYMNAPAADKATLLGKVKTIISIVINNLNQFWNDLNLPNGGLASTIIGVLQIVISTLSAFLPLLGVVALAPEKKFAKMIPVVPRSKKQLKATQVKADINAMFASNGYANHIY